MEPNEICIKIRELESNPEELKAYLAETHNDFDLLFHHERTCQECSSLIEIMTSELYEEEETLREKLEGEIALPFMAQLGRGKLLPWSKDELNRLEESGLATIKAGAKKEQKNFPFIEKLTEALKSFNEKLQQQKDFSPLVAAQCESFEENERIFGGSQDEMVTCALLSEEDEYLLWVGCKDASLEGLEFEITLQESHKRFAFKLQKKRLEEELVEDQIDLSFDEYLLIREQGLQVKK